MEISNLRACVYNFLSFWCTAMGHCAAINLKLAELIYEQIMEDVCLPESESERRKDTARKFANDVEKHLGTGSMENYYHPLSTIQFKSAVKAARCCLESSSFLWNLALRAKLANWAVRIAFEMTKRRKVYQHFNDPGCRIELILLIQSFTLHLKSASFLSSAQAIFLNTYKSDPDARVRQACSTASSRISEILHPVRPVHSFSKDILTSVVEGGDTEKNFDETFQPHDEPQAWKTKNGRVIENDQNLDSSPRSNNLEISSKINLSSVPQASTSVIVSPQNEPMQHQINRPISSNKKVTTTVTLVREEEGGEDVWIESNDEVREIEAENPDDQADTDMPQAKKLKTDKDKDKDKDKEELQIIEDILPDSSVLDLLKDFHPE